MKKLAILFFLSPVILFAQDDASEILKKSVQYHDPSGQWKKLNATFTFTETQPDGSEKSAILKLKNARNWHSINLNDENIYTVDAYGNVTTIKGEANDERAKIIRNYYVFLWGLPMKLLDENTPIMSDVESRTIDGVACHGVKVKYEEDTYAFYFSKENFRMHAYQFFKNDDSGKGEMISLKGEIKVGDMRIPKERSWYELPANKYLGTDVLSDVQ